MSKYCLNDQDTQYRYLRESQGLANYKVLTQSHSSSVTDFTWRPYFISEIYQLQQKYEGCISNRTKYIKGNQIMSSTNYLCMSKVFSSFSLFCELSTMDFSSDKRVSWPSRNWICNTRKARLSNSISTSMATFLLSIWSAVLES